MRVGTPLGDYPFEFRRVEPRDGGLAVIGTLAGFESAVVLGRGDLLRVAAAVALPVAAGAALALALRSRV
jgi:hypothetical protein